jgi:hypothetical protein
MAEMGINASKYGMEGPHVMFGVGRDKITAELHQFLIAIGMVG